MWAQKARSNWIHGDRNTRFYQTVFKQRRARNRKVHLKSANGVCVENLEEIEHLLVEHFQGQYHEFEDRDVHSILQELGTLPLPKLNQSQQQHLDRLVTDEEIEWAVYQLNPQKSPESDGIPAFFYQEFWSLIRQDVLNYVHAFLHSGTLLKSLN